MNVRAYTEADLERILTFQDEAKFDFAMPNPDNPLVVIRECLVDDEGTVRLAAFGRLQANAYLLVDRTWKTPEERLEAIQILEYAMVEKAKLLGLDQATAQVDPRFGKRLEDMGWRKGIKTTFSKDF